MAAAMIPSVIHGTTIKISPFSWDVRLPGHDIRNQATNEQASLKPELKLGFLFGRSPAGRQLLATWAW